MKKPEITKGEWCFTINREPEYISIHQRGHIGDDYENGTTTICGIWCDLSDESKANANAISAVPEMIDALVEARELINQKYFIREGDSLVLSKIEQALKKAGCGE